MTRVLLAALLACAMAACRPPIGVRRMDPRAV
jgi:hypothetical protein